MTNQEALDLVLDGIRGQGYQRATIRNSSGKEYCCYFADNGNRCSIGHLLPESAKTWAHIGMPYEDMPEEYFAGVNHVLLDALMVGHDYRLDSAQPKEDFEKYMSHLAQKFELKYTEPTE